MVTFCLLTIHQIHIVSEHINTYNGRKSIIYEKAHSLIKELLGIGYRVVRFFTGGNNLDNNFKRQLYGETTDWLINPMQTGETATQFSSRLLAMIYSHKSKKNVVIDIDHDKLDNFISELKHFD
jgi:hypothetical protein